MVQNYLFVKSTLFEKLEFFQIPDQNAVCMDAFRLVQMCSIFAYSLLRKMCGNAEMISTFFSLIL